MSYSIVVAEDEPAAAAYLCEMIEKTCPAFTLAACAGDGQEALALSVLHKPDLVLTDIRMPVMDGLELVKRLRQTLPDTLAIVVSGFQDFEYARSALQFGAVNYLLKPVSPTSLGAALELVLPRLECHAQKRRLELLRRVARGEEVETEQWHRNFPEKAYRAALTRHNGLPGRFARHAAMEVFSEKGDTMDLYGRDEMENLCLCPERALSSEALISLSEASFVNVEGYTTTVIWDRSFSIDQLNDVIKKLYQTLDSSLVIGCTQVVTVNGQPTTLQKDAPVDFAGATQVFNRILREKADDNRRMLMTSLMKEWGAEHRPQLWLEQMIGALLAPYHPHDESQLFAFLLDDAFACATSFQELLDSLVGIINRLVADVDQTRHKPDTSDLYETIHIYVDQHLADPLTLPTICRTFGISQPYVSRLFRKFSSQSFNRYLTLARIERAKELLGMGHVLIKDVAVSVGIGDPYYFSRLFRSITGMSPSDCLPQKSED